METFCKTAKKPGISIDRAQPRSAVFLPEPSSAGQEAWCGCGRGASPRETGGLSHVQWGGRARVPGDLGLAPQVPRTHGFHEPRSLFKGSNPWHPLVRKGHPGW